MFICIISGWVYDSVAQLCSRFSAAFHGFSLGFPVFFVVLTSFFPFFFAAHEHLVVGRMDGRAARRWDWVLLWTAAEQLPAVSTCGARAGQAYAQFGHRVCQDGVSFGARASHQELSPPFYGKLSQVFHSNPITKALYNIPWIAEIPLRTARIGPTSPRRIPSTIFSARTIRSRNWPEVLWRPVVRSGTITCQKSGVGQVSEWWYTYT